MLVNRVVERVRGLGFAGALLAQRARAVKRRAPAILVLPVLGTLAGIVLGPLAAQAAPISATFNQTLSDTPVAISFNGVGSFLVTLKTVAGNPWTITATDTATNTTTATATGTATSPTATSTAAARNEAVPRWKLPD